MVQWLVQAGEADVDLVSGEGRAPIHFAAINGHLEVLKWFLKNTKANVDDPGPGSETATPLVLAAINGHDQVTPLSYALFVLFVYLVYKHV